MHGGHLCTLFSARNYFDEAQNDAALILLACNEEGVLQAHTKRLEHRV